MTDRASEIGRDRVDRLQNFDRERERRDVSRTRRSRVNWTVLRGGTRQRSVSGRQRAEPGGRFFGRDQFTVMGKDDFRRITALQGNPRRVVDVRHATGDIRMPKTIMLQFQGGPGQRAIESRARRHLAPPCDAATA